MIRFRPYALVIGLVLAVPAISLAQRASRVDKPPETARNSPKIMAVFKDVVAKPSESTVRIKCDGKNVALGTIVGADGWIVTKASELKDNPVCFLKDGRQFDATVVGVEETYDLAMLKIDAKKLPAVTWTASKEAPVGNWVASAGASAEPVAIGVVSVATRNLPAVNLNAGFLGITLEPDDELARIAQVNPAGGAARAGLKANDVILAIDKDLVTDGNSLLEVLGKTKAGDVVTVRVRRGEEELQFKATLGKRPAGSQRSDYQNGLGSILSARRNGFPTILQHDTVLGPTDCGGPLVDLDGRVVGVNIARAGRTETYALPSEAVRPLLGDLMSGKLAPKPVSKAPSAEDKVKEALAAWKQAEIERAAAEAKSREALAALRKAEAELEAEKKKDGK